MKAQSFHKAGRDEEGARGINAQAKLAVGQKGGASHAR